jgi:hypothetical protein
LPNATDGEAVPSSKGERMLDALIDADEELKELAYWKDTLIFFTKDGFEIRNSVTKQEYEQSIDDGVKHPVIVPDRMFNVKEVTKIHEVDGVTHKTPNGSRRDDEKDQQCRERGIAVLRSDYTDTKSGVAAMFKQVKEFVLNVA